MSNIRIKDTSKDINLTPIEIKMRDEKSDIINDNNFNFIVNLHPTDGTHWFLVIRSGGGKFYYSESFVLRIHHYSQKNMLIWALMKENKNMMNLIVGLIVYI